MPAVGNEADPLEKRAYDFFEKLRDVSDIQIREQTAVANGMMVTVKHKKSGNDMWGWYFEKGDIRRALYTGEEIALFIDNQLSRKTFADIIKSTPFTELFKLVVVAVMTLFFGLAVVGVSLWGPPNSKSLETLNGLLGLTLGYFVGKGDTK